MRTHVVTMASGTSFEVEEGTKLVLALEQNGQDPSHRCGGQARCTTCRVKFHSDEPPMDTTEELCLEEDGVLGEFRLSCQIRVDRPMKVEVLMPATAQGWDPGIDVEP